MDISSDGATSLTCLGFVAAATPLVERRHMKRQRELLDAYSAPSSRPGLTILPDTTNLARAGEIRANTTTYSAHLNQPPNRWGSITAIAWLSKAPLYAEFGASSLLRHRQRLAQNDLTDLPLTEAESFGT